ncbi:MAG TPA: potassium transporter TrkG [Terriglobales bacterium]|nr:potassium transporter TrkG [Terriglobales bacterium]
MTIKHHFRASQVIAAGFALLILIGGLLLSLPVSNRSGEGISLLNGIFTAASATCVTGLVLYDTWSQFSLFGQIVILLLIQIGGLGFMAVAILFSLAFGRRIGLRERSLLAEAVSSMQVGGVVRLVRRMLLGTAAFELAGAALLSLRFVPAFGAAKGLWLALFHSVSAFCNAGFDLTGLRAPSTSLVTFQGDPAVILTVALLIIIGGIGFVVWNDLIECRFRLCRARLHTRAVLVSTAALIAGGTALFLCLEHSGVFADMTPATALLSAFFQSVTPRTAGFNSVDIASLSDASKFVTMALMFIGAAPGGTGGGVKVTTVVVMAAAVTASLRNREDVSLWHFRLEGETLRRAFTGAALYAAMAAGGVLVLCAQGQLFTAAVFECLSAIGTVGLTVGITPTLAPLSKAAVILLMYAGRIGSLTVFLAVARTGVGAKLRDPAGKIIVG